MISFILIYNSLVGVSESFLIFVYSNGLIIMLLNNYRYFYLFVYLFVSLMFVGFLFCFGSFSGLLLGLLVLIFRIAFKVCFFFWYLILLGLFFISLLNNFVI